MAMNPKTVPSGIVWPEIPSQRKATLLATVFELDQTQWWPPEKLRTHQFQQLAHVVSYARQSVPFYRDRLRDVPSTLEGAELRRIWHEIPILARTEVQEAGDEIRGTAIPRNHGRVLTRLTSGSTGQPLRCLGTSVTRFFWQAITLRDHLWHQRDFTRKLAAIRYTKKDAALPPQGAEFPDWGAPTNMVATTGPSVLLSTDSNVSQQADWLRRHDPSYLIAYPSNLLALADHFLAGGERLSNLLQIRSFGECLEEKVRGRCQEAWGVPLVDCYSSQEVGYVALQCPAEPVYHIQSETALVEVVNDRGQACSAGEIGRVVVTTLHNAAMPLIRYDLQDFAEVGPPCSCGRGLPVLRRVVGRQRNMITLPNGEKRWPGFGHGENLEDLPSIRQYQAVQVSLDHVELRLVQPSRFRAEEEAKIVTYMQQTLGFPFRISIRYVDEIPRGPSGKFEEFRSELED